MLETWITIRYQRFIYLVIATSITIRVVFIYLNYSNPIFNVPDEAGYAFLAERLGNGESSTLDSASLGLVRKSFTLIAPAAVLVKVGITPVLAVKLISATYGILSILMFVLILKIISLSFSHSIRASGRLQLSIVFSIFIFALLPSKIAWSSYGLRETAVEFYVLSLIYAILRFQNLNDVSVSFKNLFVPLSIAVFAACMIVMSRQEVFWLLLVSLVIPASLKGKHSRSGFLVLVTIISGTLATLWILNPPIVESKSTLIERSSISTLQNVFTIQKNRQTYANSAVVVTDCEIESKQFLEFSWCRLQNGTYLVFSFLLRPSIFLDEFYFSNQKKFAAFENIFWTLLLFACSYYLRYHKKTRTISFLFAPLLFFTAAYIVAVSQFVGNLGTAFRHKSLLLGLLLLIIYISYLGKEREEEASH